MSRPTPGSTAPTSPPTIVRSTSSSSASRLATSAFWASRRKFGREFSREEDVPEGVAVAILSHAFWQRAFHGDAAVLGRAISLRGEEYTVVGIMPHDFRAASPVDVWTPLRPSRKGEGAGSNYEVIARLRPGVSWTQAGQQLRSLSQALNADPAFPREMKNFEERI